jgi:hypothetical protein
MSGSTFAASMEVDVFGPDGKKIATYALTPEAAKKQTSFATPGIYAFRGRAVNKKGVASTNPCEAKVTVNAPPVCQLKTSCLPCKNYVGKPITIDASGSTDPDGKLARADFSISDEAGNPIDKFMDSDAPFIWDKVFDQPGTYAITVIVADDFGAVSEPCRVVLDVTQKRSFFSVEGGPFFARGSHGPYIYGEVGWFYWLAPGKVDFSLAGGGAISMKSEPWKSIILADATFSYHAGPASFGAGAGFTTAPKEGRDADFDLVGRLGLELFKTPDNFGGLTFQVRWPVGSGRSFAHNRKFGLGFRFLF